jgi:hypothetical protein
MPSWAVTTSYPGRQGRRQLSTGSPVIVDNQDPGAVPHGHDSPVALRGRAADPHYRRSPALALADLRGHDEAKCSRVVSDVFDRLRRTN